MQATMELPPTMTVRTAARFQGDLLAALDAHGDVVLDAAGVTEVDLSFVQTLYAARDHADRKDKVLRLAAPADGAVRALLERGGFLTAIEPADLDFWFHGDMPQ